MNGAYNFTKMMTVKRKMKFRSVEIEGVTSLLLFLIFALLSSVFMYIMLEKFLRDSALYITLIYALLSFIIFTVLQTIKIEEHFYKWLYGLLPKNVRLSYVQNEMFIHINFKRKGRVEHYVFKTNHKRRKKQHCA